MELIREGETDFRAPIIGHDWAVTAPGDIVPAIVWGWSEGKANARLIAAAPDMAESLARIITEVTALGAKKCPPAPHACSLCEILHVAQEAYGKACDQ